MARKGSGREPLWHRTEDNGLESPDVPLFKEFKREVDNALLNPHRSTNDTGLNSCLDQGIRS